MLTFALVRERTIYNNSLSSFDYDPDFGYDIDTMYYESSMENEGLISRLKNSHASILDSIVQYYDLMDSPKFCTGLFNKITVPAEQDLASIVEQNTGMSDALSYQNMINTVNKVADAAF